MAYPAEWVTPKEDWVSNDGIANTDLNRQEVNTRLLGERLFGHIGLAGEWYELVNPDYYLEVAWGAGAGFCIGFLSSLQYMQIDKTIFLRGQAVVEVIGEVLSVTLWPYRNDPNFLLDPAWSGSGKLVGTCVVQASGIYYSGSAFVDTDGPAPNYIKLHNQGIAFPEGWQDVFFDVVYEQKNLFVPTYLATTTPVPTSTSTTPVPTTSTTGAP